MTNPVMTVDEHGDRGWYLRGQLHREDGPAVIFTTGYKAWYIYGKRHRRNNPAVEHPNGGKEWYVNGKCHRTDGPAMEWPRGQQWWLNGNKICNRTFYQVTAGLSDEDMSFLILKYGDIK